MKTKTLIILAIIILALAGAGAWWFLGNSTTTENSNGSVQQTANTNTTVTALSDADRAGLNLSAGRCTGTDKPKLTHLPMNPEDFGMILPYGLVIGGHVTPIDHQYFTPADQNSLPDAYTVYAMADARIVSIGTRQHQGFGPNAGSTVTDYRIVFTISCRLFYYYDLVTSLAPDLKAVYDAQGNNIDFPVTAGQLIGKIGGQTLDFAVWDTDKNLTGFIVPSHYDGESWKIHTVDPLDYYTDELKAQALAKYIRTAEPRSGKIDYDIDGKLIGNWFQVGTNGYAGAAGYTGGTYWTGHLAFVPNHLDPTAFVISIGSWQPDASQFAILGNAPDPATVGVDTGLVKYDLAQQVYYTPSGSVWGQSDFVQGVTMRAGSQSLGCLLVQLTGERTLKAQTFPGAACNNVSGFTDAAVLYER